jgi:predicted permease
MEFFKNQLIQVLRRLRRTPLFTAITLITLAAGVGANTVVFSVLEGVLLKPLPYPHSEQLVTVAQSAPGINIPELQAAPSLYFIYRDQNQSFLDIGLYTGDSVSVTGLAEPERIRALLVTDGTLAILGVTPKLGRLFRREDDLPDTPQTVILNYGYWQHKFGADPSAIGRSIMVDGESRQIIGVLPKDFHFLDWEDMPMILPFRFNRTKAFLGNFSYEAVARLKPGVTLAQASADVARMIPITLRSFPPPPGFNIKVFEDAHIGPNLRPLKQDVVGDVSKMLWVLMGSIGMVLLIACANVANLLLVRVAGRRQELAVRAALGASRGRIAAELLLESVILGLLGSVIGLGLAYAALRVLVALAPTGLPRIHEIGLDATVLLFTLAISLFASILFGSIPVFKYTGARLSTGIREGGRALSESRDQHRARSFLVVVQVAMALVLLICSGLMVRSFRALTQVQPGFSRPAELQTFRISIPETEVPKAEQVVRMDEDMLHKLAAIPGVSSVGMCSTIPMDGGNSMDPVYAKDRSYTEGELAPLRRFKFMTPGFLGTLGTSIVAGRDLSWTDLYEKRLVAIVSENFAREYWSSPANALGKQIRVTSKDEWREVVGVAGNVHDDGVNKEASTSVYWPMLMGQFESDPISVRRGMAIALRSPRAGSESFLKEVREAVWSVNPNLPLAAVHTVDYYLKNSMARTSFTLIMLSVAGGMALLLGVVGIYGVIAYSVSQRTREIGIRMALGAQQRTLTNMFVRHGLWLTGIGVVCGLAAAIVLMRLMSSLLFRVSPVDPLTYSSVSIGLVFTAFLASYLPSRRTSAIDPVEALRSE